MKNIYFIGIGGIGMSALARYFLHKQKNVGGYDRTCTPLTEALEREGANIHYQNTPALIPELFIEDKENTLVVYTPAIEKDNEEYLFFKQNSYRLVKRAELLGMIAEKKTVLAVAGTHGKTTTSTMLSHIMTMAAEGCNAFLGGISKNYGTNLLLSNSNIFVGEADEYDRSFLSLHPQVALITSVDADHLDIYGSHDEVKRSFRDFIQQIKTTGALILKKSLLEGTRPNFAPNFEGRVLSYAYNEEADFYATNIRAIENGYFEFDLVLPNTTLCNCTLGIPGWINIENAIGATAVAWASGKLKLNLLAQSLRTFCGVQRRFDLQFSTNIKTYIDDYAHHPEELKASISSIRGMYPNRKITGIFQPHLFTRTRDFALEFAKSLDLLDEAILLPIYPAREMPIEGVNSQMILDKMQLSHKILCKKEDLLFLLRERNLDVLVTLGAGDIDTCVEPIKKMLKESV
ncbi:MAG: UDP-N-acetylmuramate--L-alanine ligase [Bacteroidales bacterium]